MRDSPAGFTPTRQLRTLGPLLTVIAALGLLACPRWQMDPSVRDKLVPALFGAVAGSVKGTSRAIKNGRPPRPPKVAPASALARTSFATLAYEASESPLAISVVAREGTYLGCWNCVPSDQNAVFRHGGTYGLGSKGASLWTRRTIGLICDSSDADEKPYFVDSSAAFLGCVDAVDTGCARKERHVLRRVRLICGIGADLD